MLVNRLCTHSSHALLLGLVGEVEEICGPAEGAELLGKSHSFVED